MRRLRVLASGASFLFFVLFRKASRPPLCSIVRMVEAASLIRTDCPSASLISDILWRLGRNRLLFLLLAWLTLLPVITPFPVIEHLRATRTPSFTLDPIFMLSKMHVRTEPYTRVRAFSQGFLQSEYT